MQISPKCCIVSAPLLAAAFALKCRALPPCQKRFPTSGQRPPPTFAASRQRRDLIIAKTPEGVSKEGGPQPSLFGRFKGKRFLRKGGNRNPPFLKPFFGYFLSGKKVTRRRQKKKEVRGGQSRPPLRSEIVTRAGARNILRRFQKRKRPKKKNAFITAAKGRHLPLPRSGKGAI